MTDVEFDELDKAVNSLLDSDNPKPNSVAPKPEVLNMDDNIAKQNNEPLGFKPSVDSSSSDAVPINKPEPPKSQITSRPGRFMDVVHPSSDMRPSTARPALRPVSREAKTITPLPSVENKPETTPPIQKVAEAPKTEIKMPDPIDFISEPNLAPSPKTNTETTDGAPVSPFLSDAKIEKRPLGAFSDLSSAPNEHKPNQEVPFDDDQKSNRPFDTPLPAELDPALLSIELSSPEDYNKSSSRFTSEPNIEPDVARSPSDGKIKSSEASQPASGAVYDTKNYHVAIEHPAKKNSGWTMVVWSILIILVCGGIGAAVYLFVLPK